MALNVGINGFGRIGRIIFRTCFQNTGLKVCAINDPAVDIDYICYLIKFDSTHGKFKGTVDKSENEVTIDGHKISIFKEKLPTNIPWQVADVQYVVEASGMFTNLEKASYQATQSIDNSRRGGSWTFQGHLASEGVKRVLVTAPSLDVPMVVLGVNDDKLSAGHKVISCASSTLYCLAPIIKILEDHYGVSEGFITSIHAMTPSLKPLDGLCLKGKHWRDHRSIHQNIIPATTGACRALGRIIPQVKDKMTGLAFRVPIVNVSVLDITIRLKSNTTMEGIIKQVENARNYTMHNIIKVSNEQAVSSDFVGDTFSCIVDLDSSLQLTPNFFKLICWYENEHSYACRIIDSIFFLERQYQLEWKSKMSYIRPTSKQSLVLQRGCNNKFTYHQACSYECHSNPKSLCSTSQDSGFKSPKRLPIRKHTTPSNFETRKFPCASKAIAKNKNELFKIWNDDDEIVKEPLRHNRSSFFHSCVTITPQLNTTTYTKTRERLENVKREFSKMVIMTENLLKQSQHSKIDIGLSDLPSNNVEASNVYCDVNEAKFSLDTSNNFKEIKGIDNKSKDIKEEINTFTLIDNETKNNENMFPVNRDLVDIVNNKDIYNSPVTKEKRSYSLEELKKINIDCSTNSRRTNDDENKNTINPNVLTSLVSNNDNITEKTTIASDNNIQAVTSKSALKEHENCQNETTEENNHIENDKSFQNTFWTEQKRPYPVTEQNESFSSAPVNVSDINESDKKVTNKCEAENVEPQNKPKDNLQLRLEGILKKLAIDSNMVSEKPSTCLSSINTNTTASNRDIKPKQDIYDKLDSVSATDSENSFHMKERKSQVINITDLTNSLEDLERLDKICRIMEISDDLSDQLLSALNSNDCKDLKNKKWSFKDLCEKIKLDDFCNKIFNTSS